MKLVKRNVKVGSTLYVIVGTEGEAAALDSEVDNIIDNLVPDGHRAEIDDGTTVFVEDQIVFDPAKNGSEAYVWDKTGNRAKHRRIRVTNREGERSEEFVRFVYKAF